MRNTDDPQSTRRYFRASSRVFQVNGCWYIASREGDVGPFTTLAVARRETRRFLVERQALAAFQRSREARVDLLAPCRKTADRGGAADSSVPVLSNVYSGGRPTAEAIAAGGPEVDAQLQAELDSFGRKQSSRVAEPGPDWALAVESR